MTIPPLSWFNRQKSILSSCQVVKAMISDRHQCWWEGKAAWEVPVSIWHDKCLALPSLYRCEYSINTGSEGPWLNDFPYRQCGNSIVKVLLTANISPRTELLD